MKKIIVIGIILVLAFIGVLIKVEAQSGTTSENQISIRNNQILTEISVDVKYIKENIENIKGDVKELKVEALMQEKRITKNESAIFNFCEKIDDMVVRWNGLLAVFSTLVIGMLLWMWKRVYRKVDTGTIKLNDK